MSHYTSAYYFLNHTITVNARINARGAYLIFWVESGTLIWGRLFGFSNFGLRLILSLFQVYYNKM